MIHLRNFSRIDVSLYVTYQLFKEYFNKGKKELCMPFYWNNSIDLCDINVSIVS